MDRVPSAEAGTASASTTKMALVLGFRPQRPKQAGYGIHLVQSALGWDYARACNEIEAVLADLTITQAELSASAST